MSGFIKEANVNYLFFAIFGVIAVYLAYQVVSKGGFKGAILGSRISQTIGEIPLKTSGPIKRVVRVHKLENGNVAIEITSIALLAYSMTGFALTPTQSDQLIAHLNEAR